MPGGDNDSVDFVVGAAEEAPVTVSSTNGNLQRSGDGVFAASRVQVAAAAAISTEVYECVGEEIFVREIGDVGAGKGGI